MLESFLVIDNSLENVVTDGKVTGFRFAVRSCNYRGCFVSLVNGYYVKCDGVEYPAGVQKFEINGKAPRSFEEIRTAVWEHWNYGDPAYLYIEKEGGLTPGGHVLEVMESILTQYGYANWDEEWVRNPPKPGQMAGGKATKPVTFHMTVA